MFQFFRKKFIPYTWLLILHFLLLVPIQSSHEEKLVIFDHFDKLVHFGLYAILTASWYIFIFQKKSLSGPQKINWTILLVILAIVDGIAIELLQKTPIIHRDFDWFDVLADGIGAIAGILPGRYFHHKISA